MRRSSAAISTASPTRGTPRSRPGAGVRWYRMPWIDSAAALPPWRAPVSATGSIPSAAWCSRISAARVV